jgi:hypothetical protein
MGAPPAWSWPPLSEAALRNVAEQALKRTMDLLARTANFSPEIKLVYDSTHILDIPFPFDFMNSGRAKEMLFGTVKRLALATNAQAATMITDGWAVCYSEHERRLMEEDRAWFAEYEEVCLNADSMKDIADAGYGRLTEAINILVQSPTFTLMIQQHYDRRRGLGKKPRIVFGERHDNDSTDGGHHTGRMVIWRDDGDLLEDERKRNKGFWQRQ